MNKYNIACRKYAANGEAAPDGWKSAVVEATFPDVAIKRFLGGGTDANYKFATVCDPCRIKLGPGESLQIYIKRI